MAFDRRRQQLMLADWVMDALSVNDVSPGDGDRKRFGGAKESVPAPGRPDRNLYGRASLDSEQDRQLMRLFRDVMYSIDKPRSGRIK